MGRGRSALTVVLVFDVRYSIVRLDHRSDLSDVVNVRVWKAGGI